MDGSDAILAAVMRSSLDGIIVIDEAGCVVEFNPAAEAMFGHAREDVLGRPIGEVIVPPAARGAHADGFARYLAGGEPRVLGRRIEVEAMRADGSLFPIELAITEIMGSRGRLFTACLRDLSERRAAEAALRESEARLAGFLEHAPVAMYLKTLDGRYAVANPYMLDVTGFTADEVIGHHYAEVLGPTAVEDVEATDRALLETGRPQLGEVTFPTRAGPRHTLTVRFPVRDAEGGITHLGGVVIDITDRKEAEARLRESEAALKASEARLAGFLEHAPAVMYLKDLDGRYVLANSQMLRAVGRPADEVIGTHYSCIVNPETIPEIEAADRELVATGAPKVDEGVMRGRKGVGHVLSVRFPVCDADGRITHLGGVIFDITAQKRAEAELEASREALFQTEKLTALGSLLAGVSHELNNPLAVVVGQSIIMEEDAEGTPLADAAGRIRRAAERCSRIVQTFLAMARQKKPERRAVDANELVEGALEIAGYGLRTAGVKVTRAFDAGLPPIWADPDQVHQVVINLFVNAQQAMQDQPGERALAIRTMRGRDPDRVAIEVADSGPGIPTDVARRIFEPFYTTKPQGTGTGVGLSFSRGIAEAHGGSLTLVSGTRGATFRVELPVARSSPAEPGERHADERAPSPSRKRVLIVDDEPELAQTLALFVEREGYAPDIATGGLAAREMLAERGYDAVLSDLRMPEFDGPALFAWLQEHDPGMAARIGFLTGDTLGPSATEFLRRSGRPYLGKPFSRDDVRGLLEAVTADPVR